ncbi:MAG: FAD-dependent oxidoreductase [Aliarcobacter sp.]|jgi:NADH:ubiquinone reductase (H+-translocating)|nr:FAD-dependent oxidoreductase [Aliarcobacter sp.]
MDIKKIKKIIIVGGGYAGVSLLHKLKNIRELELVLIDKSQKHLLQTHIHKYLSGHYDKEDITFNHEKFCDKNGVRFLCDEVTTINYKDNYIITRENKIEHYDYLVIATGSISIFPKQIENILEYTKDIKNIDNLDYYRYKFKKILESSPENRNIVVVGGGVSGVQIACEYAYNIRKRGFSQTNIQVTIIEGMNSILPGMDSFLISSTEERCRNLGIKIINNYFASKILKDKVILSNEQEIPYDMLLFVIGASGNLIVNNNADIKKNQRNQLIVDEFYRFNQYKNVFAIGDIAEAMDIKVNKIQAPTAQASRMQAELVAKNILNTINNIELIPNNISIKGILIDLGGPNCAIGKLFGMNISGKIALWIKKIIYSLHSKKLN